MQSHKFVSTGLKFCTQQRRTYNTDQEHFRKISKNRNNKTPEHRTEEATKALFWKSALIMALRYPRKGAEVDRKKRPAADTNHFLFQCISSLEQTSYMKGVLNHSRNRIKEIRKNQCNRQSGETFSISGSNSKPSQEKQTPARITKPELNSHKTRFVWQHGRRN